MGELTLVTAADIARLAGVTRGTVSNWRRRHQDFPGACCGTGASPVYDRAEVEAWLAARGALPELPPAELLWRTVIGEADGADLGLVVEWTAARAAALSGDTKSHGDPDAARPGSPGLLKALERSAAADGTWPTIDMLIDLYADTAGIASTPGPVASLMRALAEVPGVDR